MFNVEITVVITEKIDKDQYITNSSEEYLRKLNAINSYQIKSIQFVACYLFLYCMSI